ncbi:MAG TPA: ATP-binding protein [Solirubrobacteraceae bacterium]|jgi:anti-sigma regulatory factor (Ser/Thr protein kinase)|nr:ATP-binding protein [Solirubrobacteraceae bacterium]
MQSVVRNLNETYEASPCSVAEGRTSLANFAARAGATPSQVDAVRLATSEAMTNSVLHAYLGGPGLIYVNAAVASEELWILISDDGCGLKPRAERPGLGLGLGLISEVSDDFAVVSRATGGTEVRIRFNLVTADATAAEPARAEGVGSGSGWRAGFTPSVSVA